MTNIEIQQMILNQMKYELEHMNNTYDIREKYYSNTIKKLSEVYKNLGDGKLNE